MDPFDAQMRIMQQSNALQETVQDLYRWEKEMKRKENLSHQSVAASEPFDSEFPIRSQVTPAPTGTTSVPSTSQNASAKVSPSTKSPPSTLEKANEFKTRGNDCVKAGQFQKAIHYYTQAIRMNKFDAIYFSNRAHCYLKLNRYLECIEDCTIAIGLNENCVKAYYRRMLAHEALDDGNSVAALIDCTTVLRFEPTNIEAKKCLQRINDALKKDKSRLIPSAAAPVAVRKSQIENENILLRASTNDVPVATVEATAPWSKYEDQCDYERIDFISKQPHLRSKQPLESIEITDTFSCDGGNAGGDACRNEKIEYDSSEKADVNAPGVNNNEDAAKNVKIDVIAPQPIPKSTAQFHKIWSATNNDKQKYAILKGIYNADIAKLLGSQFEYAVLAEILIVLKHQFVPDHQPIVNIMHGIVNNMEMSIVALLMSDEDKLSFTKLLAYMRSIGENADKIDVIEKKFESYLASH